MTLHKITTKALLKVLPGRWRRRPNSRNARPQRQMDHVILDILKSRQGRYVSSLELIDYLYGDDECGGPESAEGFIRTKIHQLRREGHSIRNVYNRGYFLEAA